MLESKYGKQLEESQQEEAQRFRQYRGPLGIIVTVIAVAIPLQSVLYALDVFGYLGIFIPELRHLAFFLTLLLILLFLIVPAKKGINMNRLPWYDLALVILTIAGGGYVLVFYNKIIYYIGMASVWEQVLGVITIILILEAARRTVGWALVVVAGVFIIYPLISNFVPGFLHGRGYSLARVIGFVYFGPDGIFGISLVVAAGLLVIFILFGHFLQVSGAGEFFLKFALSLVGRVRGGPAKVAVIASSLFGTMSGSSVANVVTTGMITI
ncbi:MAG: TRAP transporter large permease subunit, partial [Dehalococcoidia bacterium]|nr:TRAP transporter large permease subunit [Dehalococcoidia bacterium]